VISGEGARHKWGLDSGFSHGLDGAARGGGGKAGGACGDDHSLKVQPQLANVVAIDSVDCVGAGPRRSRRQGGGVTHVGNIGVVVFDGASACFQLADAANAESGGAVAFLGAAPVGALGAGQARSHQPAVRSPVLVCCGFALHTLELNQVEQRKCSSVSVLLLCSGG